MSLPYVCTPSGQGVKVCARSDMDERQKPHHHATRSDIRIRRLEEFTARYGHSSAARELQEKTLAMFTSLQRSGCSAHRNEETFLDEEVRAERQMLANERRRGQAFPYEKCEGQLKLKEVDRNRLVVR